MNLYCYRKKAYPTERDALTVVYRMRAQGSSIDTYKCDACGKWHLKAVRAVETLARR